jgi:hypothetical protein
MAQPIGGGPQERAELRAKMITHLEAAHDLAQKLNDTMASLMIELALTKLKDADWPGQRPQGAH